MKPLSLFSSRASTSTGWCWDTMTIKGWAGVTHATHGMDGQLLDGVVHRDFEGGEGFLVADLGQLTRLAIFWSACCRPGPAGLDDDAIASPCSPTRAS